MSRTIPTAPLRAVHLTGSTTLLPRMRRAAEAFMHGHPDARIVIPGAFGTARGYKALLDGTADIAMASGAVPDELALSMAELGISLESTIVSQDAIVPLVHASNPVHDLSLRQLRHIFSGRIRNWREVGGNDGVIEVLGGPPAGGISSSWKTLVLGGEPYTPSMCVLDLSDRLARVAVSPLAISFLAQMPLADKRLKTVTVNAMAALPWVSAYPLRVPMMLVTRSAPPALARQFVAYTLRSRHAAMHIGDAHE